MPFCLAFQRTRDYVAHHSESQFVDTVGVSKRLKQNDTQTIANTVLQTSIIIEPPYINMTCHILIHRKDSFTSLFAFTIHVGRTAILLLSR